MNKEEIALQITLKVIEKISFSSDNVKILPYEIYNSIYNNINASKTTNASMVDNSTTENMVII